jgi:hypothetical protein
MDWSHQHTRPSSTNTIYFLPAGRACAFAFSLCAVTEQALRRRRNCSASGKKFTAMKQGKKTEGQQRRRDCTKVPAASAVARQLPAVRTTGHVRYLKLINCFIREGEPSVPFVLCCSSSPPSRMRERDEMHG